MTNAPIEQSTINKAVWEACDTFRSLMDSSRYKDYVLRMLFLKYVSDVWQDHYDSYMEEFGGDPKKIRAKLKTERFVLPPEANFYRLYEQRHEPGNGERIDAALRGIEKANIQKLQGVLQGSSFNLADLGNETQRNNMLRRVLEDFARPALNLRPSRVGILDVIGNAYEYLIKHFATDGGKKAGEFYTPPEISQLIARLANPQRGDEIYDPACGSGSLLMKCGQLVRVRNLGGSYSLYAQESNIGTWALAKMNMLLHGEDSPRIERGDTIREPKFLNPDGTLRQFDVVVANPPFSLEKWGTETAENDRFKRFRRGVPPPGKADFAFISHMVASMKPETGRMVVVVALGVLFRGGSEGKIRQRLVEENLLETVINLPAKLFYGTGIPAAILLLSNSKTDRNVLFIDASNDFQDGTAQNLLREQDLERIVATCQARQSVDKYAHLADEGEISKNQYILSISRYVEMFVEEEPVDFDPLLSGRERILEELADLNLQMASHLEFYGLTRKPGTDAPPLLENPAESAERLAETRAEGVTRQSAEAEQRAALLAGLVAGQGPQGCEP